MYISNFYLPDTHYRYIQYLYAEFLNEYKDRGYSVEFDFGLFFEDFIAALIKEYANESKI